MEERLRELERRRQACLDGGGEQRRQKQHEAGKHTARERLEMLLDRDSFVELQMFTEHRCRDFGMDGVEAPGDGVVTGFGRVDGRLVYVYVQDFTVVGGTLGEAHSRKICQVLDLALKAGAPVIGVNDSGGARIQEGVSSLNGYGEIFFRNTQASGVIPQLSVIMGPCAGGASYSPALMDFVFMVDGTSQMFITGPQVVKQLTGEEVSAETLGGAGTHSRLSGVAHFRAGSEEECFAQVKRLLGYLPSSNREAPPRAAPGEPPAEAAAVLLRVVPQNGSQPYDVREVIRCLVDGGDWLEIQRDFAPNVVVGLARLAGRPVGLVANQPWHLAGSLDINSSDKAARFVRFCDAFHIPLVTLVDTPGYLPGADQEVGGIIRHGAKLLYAYAQATVPKLTVILRKAYGGAYLAMCSRALGADQVFAWPGAEIAVMGPEGAAQIIFREEVRDNPQAFQARTAEYRERFANPYVAAARGFVDQVIDPRETRRLLLAGLEALDGKREARPEKKHGNMPC